jgi:hypothetical protein
VEKKYSQFLSTDWKRTEPTFEKVSKNDPIQKGGNVAGTQKNSSGSTASVGS